MARRGLVSTTRRTFLRGLGVTACAPFVLQAEVGPDRTLALLDAVSNLGLKPPSPGKEPGVRGMAAALRSKGLIDRLRASGVRVEDAGSVIAPPYRSEIDPSTHVRNAASLREYSVKLATRVDELLGLGRFPLILGGDCSILLGSALGLRRRGRYGLLFIDGHADLLTPETSQSGGAAGMDLALTTGDGPEALTHLEGRKPYIQPGDVAVYGYRVPTAGDASAASPQPPMRAFPLSVIRHASFASSATQIVAQLNAAPTKGFWVHVDLDVLASAWMPAVDSPEPGGMTLTELTTVLRCAVRSSRCVGMEFTIYDPTLDPERSGAELINHMLSEVFA